MLRSIRLTPVVAIALLVAGCGLEANGVQITGSFDRTLPVSAGPVDLTLSTGSGSIDVRVGSADSIRVVGRIRVRPFRLSGMPADEQLKQLEANPPIEQAGNAVRVGEIKDAQLRRGVSISYEVTVPPATRVRSHTGSGSQSFDGIRGALDASAGSGKIRVGRVGGHVTVATGSGSIEVVEAADGLDASAGSGSIRADAVAGAIRARTGSGRIELTQTAQGDVDVSAGSGSLAVHGVNGGIRLQTGSGRIVVDGTPLRDWHVKAASGSVEMQLPPDAGFRLDASTRSGSINSAHPVEMQGAISRRRVQGQVRGGGPSVAVSTGSGSIRIN